MKCLENLLIAGPLAVVAALQGCIMLALFSTVAIVPPVAVLALTGIINLDNVNWSTFWKLATGIPAACFWLNTFFCCVLGKTNVVNDVCLTND